MLYTSLFGVYATQIFFQTGIICEGFIKNFVLFKVISLRQFSAIQFAICSACQLSMKSTILHLKKFVHFSTACTLEDLSPGFCLDHIFCAQICITDFIDAILLQFPSFILCCDNDKNKYFLFQNRRKDRFHLPEFTLRHYNTQRLVCAVSDQTPKLRIFYF